MARNCDEDDEDDEDDDEDEEDEEDEDDDEDEDEEDEKREFSSAMATAPAGERNGVSDNGVISDATRVSVDAGLLHGTRAS